MEAKNGTTKILQMSYADYLDYWIKEYFEINYKYSTAKRYKETFIIIHNELGIKNCRFDDLRASYVTKTLRNGAEIRDVADILGHTRIETTENYYISSSEKTRKEANNMIAKIIRSDVINEIIEILKIDL